MAFRASTPVITEGLPITFRDQTVWRDPDAFGESCLLMPDFDETCFTTFISRGDGIEVHRAYELAVDSVLGPNARSDFSGYGGLSNRAPLDVIEGLIANDNRLIVNALDHAKRYFTHPADITDIGLGMIARFANRGRIEADELTLRAVTEMLVVRKKEHLIPQISLEWPTPVKGFEEAWLQLYEKRREKDWKGVHTAIVSSGHTDFIQATLEVRGLPLPDVFMTDDEMRRQVEPHTKPDPYALELVERAWLNAYAIPQDLRTAPGFMTRIKQRQLYVGDDPAKDGEMATRHNVGFIRVENSPDSWPFVWNAVVRAVENGGVFHAAA